MTAIALDRSLEPNTARSASAAASSSGDQKNFSPRQRFSLLSLSPALRAPLLPPPTPLRSTFFTSRRDGFGVQGEQGGGGLDREDVEEDDFLSPPETRSATSCCSSESSVGFRTRTPNHSEFYDAVEDGSVSQSSPSLTAAKNECELHLIWVNLIEEIERRKTAEMTLLQMQNHWQRLGEYLSKVGVSFPASQRAGGVQLEIDPAALCQEILFTRFVSEAVERGLSRVETEATAEAVLDAKNRELSRLHDRLHYHEVVNREMSLRNEEIAGLAHQKRIRRKTRRRWIWSCMGLSVTLGASLLAYSYLAHSAEDPPVTYYQDNHHAETF